MDSNSIINNVRTFLSHHDGSEVQFRRSRRGALGIGPYDLLQTVENGVIHPMAIEPTVDDSTAASISEIVQRHNEAALAFSLR